ncbi:MAG: hypothetical protein KAQ67_13280, partial [Gammaproteobacteria bacterium]|nr:hypothetical protein [Gammaproteobacteria bacterium]
MVQRTIFVSIRNHYSTTPIFMDKTKRLLREKFSWAMYDFANSGYATVVLTTIFNTWFVSGIAMSGGFDSGTATLLWTIAIAIGNLLILFSAP